LLTAPPAGVWPVAPARLGAPGPDLADHSLMKGTGRLIVMRHAKAGELPGGPDFERALKSRGRNDSGAAGEWLRAGGYRPEVVLCSAARRARQTWQYVSETLLAGPQGAGSPGPEPAAPEPAVQTERRLYEADAAELAEIIRETPAAVGTLMYVGHNPAAADLVAMLTGTEPHFPTAAIAVIDTGSAWAELAAGDGELAAVWTPSQG
jgi:phosphohistidine phosphatase